MLRQELSQSLRDFYSHSGDLHTFHPQLTGSIKVHFKSFSLNNDMKCKPEMVKKVSNYP